MTQEEKQILLKDLCARLPYHPNIRVFNPDGFEGYMSGEFDTSLWAHHIEPFRMDRFETIKPYLRPMSSMTEEERQDFAYYVAHGSNSVALDFVDWCNAHHFDYRGLIGKGLALVAPEDMYTKEDKL